jgi:hypothetical protein
MMRARLRVDDLCKRRRSGRIIPATRNAAGSREIASGASCTGASCRQRRDPERAGDRVSAMRRTYRAVVRCDTMSYSFAISKGVVLRIASASRDACSVRNRRKTRDCKQIETHHRTRTTSRFVVRSLTLSTVNEVPRKQDASRCIRKCDTLSYKSRVAGLVFPQSAVFDSV